MKAIIVFCMLLIAMPVFAGTWHDDFEDGNFDGWTSTQGNLPVTEKGELVFAQGDACHFATGKEEWSDYTVQADVMIAKNIGCAYPQAGISARSKYPQSTNWYEFLFVWIPQTVLMVNHVSAGFVDNPKTMPPFNVEMGRWYHFKMVLERENVKTYLDDNIILEFNDSSEMSGRIELISWGLETHFDNIIITGANIPDGGSWDKTKHLQDKLNVDTKGKITTTWGEVRRTK